MTTLPRSNSTVAKLSPWSLDRGKVVTRLVHSDFRERGEAEEPQEGRPPAARKHLRLDIGQPCTDELGYLPQVSKTVNI